jgi:hypothetical protein
MGDKGLVPVPEPVIEGGEVPVDPSALILEFDSGNGAALGVLDAELSEVV